MDTKQMAIPMKDYSPYRACIESLSLIYLRNSKQAFPEFLLANRASRRLMLDGYNAYVYEGLIDPLELAPLELKNELWEFARQAVGESTEQKADLCRAIYFLMKKVDQTEPD